MKDKFIISREFKPWEITRETGNYRYHVAEVKDGYLLVTNGQTIVAYDTFHYLNLPRGAREKIEDKCMDVNDLNAGSRAKRCEVKGDYLVLDDIRVELLLGNGFISRKVAELEALKPATVSTLDGVNVEKSFVDAFKATGESKFNVSFMEMEPGVVARMKSDRVTVYHGVLTPGKEVEESLSRRHAKVHR